MLHASLLLAAVLVGAPLVGQSFGSGCGGYLGQQTAIAVTPPMRPGQTSQFSLTNLPPNSSCVLVLGMSATQWAGQPLPMALDSYGMPGCRLFVEAAEQYPFVSGTSSTTSWSFTMPPIPALAGQQFYFQTVFPHPGLNAVETGISRALAAAVGSLPSYASQVSQWGITWTFSQPHQVGQFANGDWWVVGPVTVTGISPQTSVVNGRVVHGSMINPDATGRHGYDSTLYHTYQNGNLVYDASKNVALSLPRVVPAGSSLISTISNMNSGSGNVSQLQTAAVLTVLDAEPLPGSFRPPYAGTDKTVRFHAEQLDISALAQLPPVPGAPSLAQLESQFERVWLDHAASWLSAYIHPVQNMPFYYREFTSLTGTAGLLLNSNYTFAQKRKLLIRLVQVGIDNFGVMQAGARWYANGHCNGRKFPILFAGRMLNDPDMLSAGITYATVYHGPFHPGNRDGFSEDGQVFYVTETSPGVYNWGYGGYTSQHAGMPEWSMFHTDNCGGDNVSWTASPYRVCCSANGWTGVALTTRIMGLRPAWNNQAFFDYMDRYLQTESPGSWTFSWDTWSGAMWTAYRPQF